MTIHQIQPRRRPAQDAIAAAVASTVNQRYVTTLDYWRRSTGARLPPEAAEDRRKKEERYQEHLRLDWIMIGKEREARARLLLPPPGEPGAPPADQDRIGLALHDAGLFARLDQARARKAVLYAAAAARDIWPALIKLVEPVIAAHDQVHRLRPAIDDRHQEELAILAARIITDATHLFARLDVFAIDRSGRLLGHDIKRARHEADIVDRLAVQADRAAHDYMTRLHRVMMDRRLDGHMGKHDTWLVHDAVIMSTMLHQRPVLERALAALRRPEDPAITEDPTLALLPRPVELQVPSCAVPLLRGAKPLNVRPAAEHPRRSLLHYSYQSRIAEMQINHMTDARDQLPADQRDKIRMCVISLGYVDVDENLGKAIAKLGDHLAALERAMGAWGVKMLWAVTEGPLRRDLATGRLRQHLHVHVAYLPTCWIAGWNKFLEAMRAASPRGYFHDAGQVIDFAEFSSYLSKGMIPAGAPDEQIEGMDPINIEDIRPEEMLLLRLAWHCRSRIRWFGAAAERQQALKKGWAVTEVNPVTGVVETRHAAIKVVRQGAPIEVKRKVRQPDGSVKEETVKDYPVVCRAKWPAGLRPEYEDQAAEAADIVTGDLMVPVVVDADLARRLDVEPGEYMCAALRVMHPSEQLLAGGMNYLAERRQLAGLVRAHEAIWLERVRGDAARRGATNYLGQSAVNGSHRMVADPVTRGPLVLIHGSTVDPGGGSG